jgi:hypothetical protein
MRGSICGAILGVAGLALPGSGQAPAAPASPAAISKPAPPARLPYMAEFKILQVQKLANGTALTHQTTIVTARDSQGRHLKATTAIPMWTDQTATTHFQVIDPVAHATLNWRYPGREATVMALPFSVAVFPGCSYMTTETISPGKKTTVEDLGTMTVQGVEAQGRRTTTAIPIMAYKKHKTHKPPVRKGELVSTAELWTAIDPGLNGLLVREVDEDAWSNKVSKELVNFSQSEPNAAFFKPPRSYAIVNREVNADLCVSLWEMESPAAPNLVLPQLFEQEILPHLH